MGAREWVRSIRKEPFKERLDDDQKNRLKIELSATEKPESRNLAAEMTKGAFAGIVGTAAMDIVTWHMYLAESRTAFEKEKRAQVNQKWASHALGDQLNQRFDLQLSGGKKFALGQIIHYVMGAMPGMLYPILARRFPAIRRSRGLLFGLGVFLMVDEVSGPLMGISSPPHRYPLQAHLRGLAGHLAYGAATDATLETLELPG